MYEMLKSLLEEAHHSLQRIEKLMSKLDDSIAILSKQVENQTTVEKSAIVLLNQIGTLIKNAVDAALAAGATPAQLTALADLATTISANETSLAAAVVANTPTA